MSTIYWKDGTRTYTKNECAVFFKVSEKWGLLSNMARTPFFLVGQKFWNSEALYQALKFPDNPKLQQEIVNQASPINSKKISRSASGVRPDWDSVRVGVMKACLKIKANKCEDFRRELLSTGQMPIVELSYKDKFWGAEPINNQELHGTNALGRILMETREMLRNSPEELLDLNPGNKIPDLKIFGQTIKSEREE